MIKKIATTALLSTTILTSANAFDPETLHVGVAHGTNTIHLGLDIDDDLRVEGYMGYQEDFDKRVDLGVGGFYKTEATADSHIYFGARLGFVDYDRQDSGILIQPVFGYEYKLHSNISLGAEAGYNAGSGDIANQTITNLTLRYYF